MQNFHFETQALHAGHDVDKTAGTRAVPIYQTTSYVFRDTTHAANLFSLAEPGYIYTRLNNPTNDVLEQRLTALDGGIGAAVFASGTAAIATTFLTLLKTGDHIVASSHLYGGTWNLLQVTLRRFGIHTDFVDPTDVANFKAAVKPHTRAFFIETLGNPKLQVLDIQAIAELAHEAGVPLIVDNTLPTPFLCRTFDFGADINVYSLTKYIGGQGTSLGGAVVDSGRFDWANGKFPEFTTPNPGYHGLKLVDALGKAAFIGKIRLEGLRDIGAAASPFNVFQLIQGLETLPLRLIRHSENALALAQWLGNHPRVAWVNYPGLPASPSYELAQKYLPAGQSGMLTFGVKGGYEAAKKTVDNTRLFSLLANIGDTKSLIIHPASTTHQQLSAEEQLASGVTPDLIRVSVGIENIQDLIADLGQALTQNP